MAYPFFVSHKGAYLETMGKLSLLKEYLKLTLSEAGFVGRMGPMPPFQLSAGSTPVAKGRGAEFIIYREFPVVPTPELMHALRVDETDLDENGLLGGEHEIGLDVDFYYEKPERMTRDYPGTPGGYSVDDWEPVTFNGFQLSKQDAQALKEFMGELTDTEEESLIEQRGEDEPDFDDGGYY